MITEGFPGNYGRRRLRSKRISLPLTIILAALGSLIASYTASKLVGGIAISEPTIAPAGEP